MPPSQAAAHGCSHGGEGGKQGDGASCEGKIKTERVIRSHGSSFPCQGPGKTSDKCLGSIEIDILCFFPVCFLKLSVSFHFISNVREKK
jgi:hypothetical protein